MLEAEDKLENHIKHLRSNKPIISNGQVQVRDHKVPLKSDTFVPAQTSDPARTPAHSCRSRHTSAPDI